MAAVCNKIGKRNSALKGACTGAEGHNVSIGLCDSLADLGVTTGAGSLAKTVVKYGSDDLYGNVIVYVACGNHLNGCLINIAAGKTLDAARAVGGTGNGDDHRCGRSPGVACRNNNGGIGLCFVTARAFDDHYAILGTACRLIHDGCDAPCVGGSGDSGYCSRVSLAANGTFYRL